MRNYANLQTNCEATSPTAEIYSSRDPEIRYLIGPEKKAISTDWYINECLRQLNDTKFYKLLDNDVTTDIQKRILKYTERMNRDKIINEETKRYLIETDPKPGRFYILPKVHKQGNPGRPIVSSNSHPTERISQFVDHHLKPLVQTTQSFILVIVLTTSAPALDITFIM